MTTAKQIVEAEIGPQDAIGDFVGGALKADFLLSRLAFRRYLNKPFVYDTVTGNIVCYLITHWAGNDLNLPCDDNRLSYKIDTTGTFAMMQFNLKRDPGYSNSELREMGEHWFGSWQSATRFFLTLEASQRWLKDGLLIEATGQHISALAYHDRLERMVQQLAKNDFFTEKIDRRAGKGTSCYVLGRCESLDPVAVAEIVRSAGAIAGLVVENQKAAMRNERTWQIDFNVANLFESTEDFVTTAFREEVPGHAELERLQQFRDTLRSMGLPVYSIIAEPGWGGETICIVYFDNRQLNLGKTKTANIAEEALRSIGYGSQVDVLNRTVSVGGHGEKRYIYVRMKALKPQKLGSIKLESEEIDYTSYGEVAAARQGTIGDELRLKRLVTHLKKLGFTVKEASMQQMSSIGGRLQNYLAVEYRLGFVYHPKLALEDTLARQQIQTEVAHFLNVDRDFCGGKVVPFSNVQVAGGHVKWNQFTVTVMAESLRKPSIRGGEYDRMDTVKLQLEADMDEYGEIAIDSTPGLRTRLWLKKLKAKLESKKLCVRNIHAVQHRYKMRIVAHINAAENSTDLYPHTFTSDEIIKIWYWAVKETGSEVINDAGEYTRIVADSERAPIVYSIKGYVQQIEGSKWEEGSKLDEAVISLDDMGIEEHERLWGVAVAAEAESRTNPVLKPVAVLWAQVSPIDSKALDLPEGTVYIRMRMVVGERTDAIYAFNSGLSKSGSKRVIVGARLPTLGIYKSLPVNGRNIMDIYAYVAPVGKPLLTPITIRGPSSEMWPHYIDIDEPNRVLEAFEPEDEVWVRRVIERTPGYRDMERLKSAVRSIEEMGIEVLGASQVPHSTSRNDTVCDATVAINKLPTETSATHQCRVMAKIRTALEAYWDLLDLRHEYDTTDGRHSVWLWKWHSYDAPKDIVPLYLRYGNWNEYASSGMACRELDSFLVEQFDAPGDDEPYTQMFHAAQNTADPLWRERLRVREIANFIKERGYGGSVRLEWHPPTIFFTFTHHDPLRMEEYFTKDLLHAINNKFSITSPGLVWAHAHALRRSFQNEHGQPESRCHLPYMFTDNTPVEVKTGTEPLHAEVNEALEFTPRDMARYARVASTPDKLTVVRRCWEAFLKHFHDAYPAAFGWANYLQEPRPGNFSTFEFSIDFTHPQLPEQLRTSYTVRKAIEDKFRNAVLNAGLKRYYPRRTLYYKWPAVNLYLKDLNDITLVCKFSLKNLKVEDKAVHVPNIHALHEGLSPDDLDAFVDKALPDLGDLDRLKTMLDQWANLSRYITGGVAWGETDYINPKRWGKHHAYIEINVLAKNNDSNHVHNAVGYVRNEIIELLSKHGYGKFTSEGIGENTLDVQPLAVNSLARWGWHVKLRGVVVNTPVFPKTEIRFGDFPTDIPEILDINPEDFGREVIRQTDPAGEVIGRFQAAVRSLKRAHWDWIQDGTMKIGGGSSGVIFAHTHFLFKPGQEKPKEFVTNVTRQALEAQGFQIEKIRPAAAPGGITVMVSVTADAVFVVHKFPELFIDFDTVSLSEHLKEGMTDPDEFVSGSEQGTKFAVFRCLSEIAGSLKQDGWVGYIHASNWQSIGYLHRLFIHIGKNVDSKTSEASEAIDRAFKSAVQPTYKVEFVHMQLPGYPHIMWHWKTDVLVDLCGRCGQSKYSINVDIESGTIDVSAMSADGFSGRHV